MRRKNIGATCFSYLDDWLLLADTWHDLDTALSETIRFDLATGPVLNHDYCVCAEAAATGEPKNVRPANVLTLACASSTLVLASC